MIAFIFISVLWIILILGCFAAFKVGGDYDEDT